MAFLLDHFCDMIKFNSELNLSGDIIEFGTGNADSSQKIASSIPNDKKFITFDGFIGLPPTEKGIPYKTGWEEGNLKYSYENAVSKLSKFNNTQVIKTMSWELKTPEEYGISEIAAVNFDFDLYEGTLDGLRFIDKANWKNVLLRFDDWGAYDFQIAEEVDKHEKAAFYDWIKETGYDFFEYDNLTKIVNGLQSIILVKR